MSESTPEDRLEQQSSPSGDQAHREAPDVPLEAESADVLRQAVVVELDPDERR